MISIRKLKWRNLFGNYQYATLLDNKERSWINHLVEAYDYSRKLPDDIMINRSVLYLVFVLHSDLARYHKIARPLVEDLDDTIEQMKLKKDPELVKHYTEVLSSLSQLRDAGEVIDDNIDVVQRFHEKECRNKTAYFDEMCAHIMMRLRDKHKKVYDRICGIT